jgi:ribosomal protein S17
MQKFQNKNLQKLNKNNYFRVLRVTKLLDVHEQCQEYQILDLIIVGESSIFDTISKITNKLKLLSSNYGI